MGYSKRSPAGGEHFSRRHQYAPMFRIKAAFFQDLTGTLEPVEEVDGCSHQHCFYLNCEGRRKPIQGSRSQVISRD